MATRSLLKQARELDRDYFGPEAEERSYNLLAQALPAEQWHELQEQSCFTVYTESGPEHSLWLFARGRQPLYHVYALAGRLVGTLCFVVSLGSRGTEEVVYGWFPSPKLPWGDCLLIAWLVLNNPQTRTEFRNTACQHDLGDYTRVRGMLDVLDYGDYLRRHLGLSF